MTFNEMVDLIVQRKGWAGFTRPSNLRYAPHYGASWTFNDLFVVSTIAGTVILVLWAEGPGLWLTAKGTLHTFRLGSRRSNSALPLWLTDVVLSRLPDTEPVVGVGIRDLQAIVEQGPRKITELRLKGEIWT